MQSDTHANAGGPALLAFLSGIPARCKLLLPGPDVAVWTEVDFMAIAFQVLVGGAVERIEVARPDAPLRPDSAGSTDLFSAIGGVSTALRSGSACSPPCYPRRLTT